MGLGPLRQAGLADALAALIIPPAVAVPPSRRVVWVQPRPLLVVRHLGWTAAGQLRQPMATTVRTAP